MIIVLLVVALTGCAARGGTTAGDDDEGTRGGAGSAASVPKTDFGTLKNVCGPGEAKPSGAQGVTDTEIKVGVFTDQGFSKKPEMVDAAKVFTEWCNAAGGINGRKLVPVTRDAKLMEVRQRMTEACKSDFAVVGGSAGLDGQGVETRLECVLPEFPAQSSQVRARGADLQVMANGASVGYNDYAGFYRWLVNEKHPSSKGDIGIIAGDSPVTKIMVSQHTETVAGVGGKVTYTGLYPVRGVPDWTPFAQAMKDKKVKGLVFLGSLDHLAKLLQSLTSIGHKLDWVDTTNNAYGPQFVKLAGAALGSQTSYADLSGMHPLEKAADNPATQQVLDMFGQYAPDAEVNLPVLRSFSAWLLFAKSARACGELTRACVLENAQKETAWTAGGLRAPLDLSNPASPPKCWNAVQATPDGWKPADFGANEGAYRCDDVEHEYTGDYPPPAKLEDVGKSMADLD
ncbi:ABC-type branched-subunit amino acid transport system substrate-binding protein [Actinomadura algeriensis]|uniref:ABC-type branched-subunit amino acid transport system substrate-binding protein n=1 Tax=Actinomadura algeriensis TaxID=1679523 RepID=A0ABR9JYN3_9ACTN|nr:ABC-type branched-subunit amino acid transport system substrate-binding protein [Actinomadura algeriensis]